VEGGFDRGGERKKKKEEESGWKFPTSPPDAATLSIMLAVQFTLSPVSLILGAVIALIGRELVHHRYYGPTPPTTLVAYCPTPPSPASPHHTEGVNHTSGVAPGGSHGEGSHSPAAPGSSHVFFKFPPAVKRVIINVGSNRQPPVPKEDDVAVIAVEPMLNTAWAIPRHERVFVITAAISSSVGFANFFTYMFSGEASSLSEVKQEDKEKPEAWWARDDHRETDYPPLVFVPVLTLKHLLDAVPPTLDIVLLKTDMQGYDFTAVSAAGDALHRVKQLYSEVNCHGFAYNPSAPLNDFDAVWADYMARKGYTLDRTVMCPDFATESNALWTREGVTPPSPGVWWE
jgi:hypothetical protein